MTTQAEKLTQVQQGTLDVIEKLVEAVGTTFDHYDAAIATLEAKVAALSDEATALAMKVAGLAKTVADRTEPLA